MARSHSEPLPRATPLWRVWLVAGLECDDFYAERFALLVQVHHAFADGLGCLQLLAMLLDAAPCREAEAGAEIAP
jgi:NRPS condensation-like uncharacterized protein